MYGTVGATRVSGTASAAAAKCSTDGRLQHFMTADNGFNLLGLKLRR